MGEDILIAKNKDRERIQFKVRNRTNKKFSPNSYEKVLNPRNYVELSTLFEDLNLLFNSPIEKAFRTYHEKKNKGFPF